VLRLSGALKYNWSLRSVPANSSAKLVNPTSVHPTFTPKKAGTCVATQRPQSVKYNVAISGCRHESQDSCCCCGWFHCCFRYLASTRPGDCVGRLETATSTLTQNFSKLAVDLTDWFAWVVLDAVRVVCVGVQVVLLCRLFYCAGCFTVCTKSYGGAAVNV
jgi:hypothetical protein